MPRRSEDEPDAPGFPLVDTAQVSCQQSQQRSANKYICVGKQFTLLDKEPGPPENERTHRQPNEQEHIEGMLDDPGPVGAVRDDKMEAEDRVQNLENGQARKHCKQNPEGSRAEAKHDQGAN